MIDNGVTDPNAFYKPMDYEEDSVLAFMVQLPIIAIVCLFGIIVFGIQNIFLKWRKNGV